jgi:putative transposase
MATIAYLFAKHKATYGSPRITADLRAMGWRVSPNTVAALMREQDLVARRKRRRRGSTKPDRSARKAPDLLRRDFAPRAQPNVAWVGDLTEIPTDEGKLQLSSTCIRGGCPGSPWTSTTTPRWHGPRCAWPSRCVADR